MYKAKLSIQETVWSGFAVKTGEPTSQVKDPYTIEVQNEQEITLQYANTNYLITVSDITETSVSLHSDNLSIKNKGYGYSLQPKPADTTLQIDQAEVFHTPTMDAGSKWEIKLLGIAQINTKEQPQPPIDKLPIPTKKTPVKIKTPKLNWRRTQELIDALEKKLATRVICFFTSPESYMNQNQADLFVEHLRKTNGQSPLSLVLISGGGSPSAALRIAAILREYSNNLQILVPSVCASAATMLSLSADKIIMSPAGYLTAIDSSATHPLNPKDPRGRPVPVSVDQVKRVIKFLNDEGVIKDNEKFEGSYRTLFKYLHPLVVGELDRASSMSEMVATRIMRMHPQTFGDDEKILQISKHLINNYPVHGFPVLFNEAKEIGLPVEKADDELADILWDLVKVYESTTFPTVTHLGPGFYHNESYSAIIESTGKRTSYRYSYNKRFNPGTRGWELENNNSRWLNFRNSDKSPDLVNVTTLDMPDPDVSAPKEVLTPNSSSEKEEDDNEEKSE